VLDWTNSYYLVSINTSGWITLKYRSGLLPSSINYSLIPTCPFLSSRISQSVIEKIKIKSLRQIHIINYNNYSCCYYYYWFTLLLSYISTVALYVVMIIIVIMWLRYGLDEREIVVRFPALATLCSLLQNVQTGAEVCSASHLVGTVVLCPESKAVGAWTWPTLRV